MKIKSWLLTVILVATIFFTGAVIVYYMILENESKNNPKKQVSEPIAPSNIIDKQLVAPDLLNTTAARPVQTFSFINQYGDTITKADTRNKIYVADYFFTSCGGICPAMAKQMKRIQDHFKDEEDVLLLSHTVWPEVDSVPIMKRYASKHEAIKGKWHFLTGDKEELYRLARRSYFVLKPAEVKGQGDGNSDFIHTDQFVLVDRSGHIRAYHKGTDPEEVDELIQTIEYLLE